MKLKEVIDFKNGRKKPKEIGDIPIYGGNGVTGYTNDFNSNKESIIVGRVGAYCGCVYRQKNKCWISDNAIVGHAKGNNDFDYLYYLLKSINLNSLHIGSSQPLITQEILNNIDINVCDYETQRKIGKILSVIDEKIELNNNIDDNLFEYMENLYKEWFVKFSIFKEEEFKNSELGEIPRSCQVKDIYAIANIIYGAPFKSNLFNTDKKGIPIIRIRDLKSQEFKTYTEEKHPKGYLLKYGDIAVGMDGEFKPYIWGNEGAWLNQRVCVFNNIREKGKAFLYYTLKPLLNYIETTETATTVIHIGKNDFDKFKIILPNDEVLNTFDEITTPLIEKIINNIKENKTLSRIRDTLLPKLVNGEIDLDKI